MVDVQERTAMSEVLLSDKQDVAVHRPAVFVYLILANVIHVAANDRQAM